MKVAQAMLTSSRKLLLVLALPMLLAGGCTVLPPTPLTHSPDFAPVQPVSSDRTRLATGGIYNSRVSESWFGRGRNYQVGDVITVLLSESTQAKRSQDSKVSRDSSNNVVPKGLAAKAAGLAPGLLSGLKTRRRQHQQYRHRHRQPVGHARRLSGCHRGSSAGQRQFGTSRRKTIGTERRL